MTRGGEGGGEGPDHRKRLCRSRGFEFGLDLHLVGAPQHEASRDVSVSVRRESAVGPFGPDDDVDRAVVPHGKQSPLGIDEARIGVRDCLPVHITHLLAEVVSV